MVPRSWGATPAEMARSYPCDTHLPDPYVSHMRAIDVAAPAHLVFRWLCQLKLGSYSYPLLAGKGDNSPPTLTAGTESLAIGQHFLVFTIVDFEPGVHLTGVIRDDLRRRYGPIAVTYEVVADSPASSRIVVRVNVGGTGPIAALRREFLAAGDLVMMRKQLLTLKRLAEQ